jgi:uncharacterized protein (TIGR03118 family)
MFSFLLAKSRKLASRSRLGRTPRVRPQVETLECRCVLATAYLATDLVSDQPGVAPVTDPTLVNAWGISLNPAGGAIWVSSADAGLSEVYSGDVNGSPISQPFKVNIPGGSPTGQVFAGLAGEFVVSGLTRAGAATSAASTFIFATETGTVAGWNPNVFASPIPPAPPAGPSTNAITAFTADDGANYKGLALARVGTADFLYAADFHNGKIDVLDSTFQKVTLGASGFETFTDPDLPSGYAPFNVAAIGGKIYVSYALQDADAEDEVAGKGLGFVSVFETNGHFDGRLISQGALNAPWALVQATADFGDFSNALLVGNFGDGRINAYDIQSGAQLGTLSQAAGKPLVIDGLWGLAFGNGVSAGDANSLYYAAGPEDETHGLFGKITANPAGTNPVQAELTDGTLLITGSRNDDHVEVKLKKKSEQLVVQAGGQVIGTFAVADVETIQFLGLAGDDHFRIHQHIAIPAILDGGADNDFLAGSQASDILLGGPGNDHLHGARANDLLIGGDGRDHLQGQKGDDLLIGGTTIHDANLAALMQILAELNSADDYATRIAKLRAGTSGLPILDDMTVLDDAARDILHGGQGLDWFFAGPNDKTPGKKSSEQVN